MIDNAFQTYLNQLKNSESTQFEQGLSQWCRRTRAEIEQLANLCLKKHKYQECKELYDALFSLQHSPSLSQALNYNLCLKSLQLPQQQYDFLIQQTRSHPDYYQLWHALGNVQKHLGFFLEAKESYVRAITINPCNTDLLYSSTSLSGFDNLSRESLEHLETTLKDPSQPNSKKTLAAFILGQKLMLDKAYQEGFERICLANQLHMESNPLRLQFDANHRQKLMQHFRLPFFKQWQTAISGLPKLDSQQIFIIGMSRSGKTLIENILRLSPGLKPEQESMELVRFVRRHLDNRPKANLNKFLKSLNPIKLNELREDYRKVFSNSAEASTYTMPWNITELGYVGLLNPEAKIIFVTRDYLDLGFACFTKVYAFGNSYASDLGALGEQIALYEQLMLHWQNNLPNPCLQLSYENLVKEPISVARKLFDFCGLAMNPTTLDQAITQATDIDVNFSQSQDFLTKITDQHIGSSQVYQTWLRPMMNSYKQSWQLFNDDEQKKSINVTD